MGVFCSYFRRVIVSVIGPYSCWFLSMCCAYADCGSLMEVWVRQTHMFYMYLMCS
jgi:hypothetical protein